MTPLRMDPYAIANTRNQFTLAGSFLHSSNSVIQ